MSTFEAYFALGAMSIAVSTIGATLTLESKEAPVTTPTAVLTVLVPEGQSLPSNFAAPIVVESEDQDELE